MGLNIFDFYKDFAELLEFFEIDSAQYDTARNHSILHGFKGHFLKLLHRPLKEQCHKNKCIYSDYAKKGYIFQFCSKVSD